MPNSTQTIPFNFNQTAVRVINQDNNAWFIAQDISDALGYRDANAMTRVLDADEKGTHTVSTLGGNQEMLAISESGLYHAEPNRAIKQHCKGVVKHHPLQTAGGKQNAPLTIQKHCKTSGVSKRYTGVATGRQGRHLLSLNLMLDK